jgi:hypothetical protein
LEITSVAAPEEDAVESKNIDSKNAGLEGNQQKPKDIPPLDSAA